MNSIERVLKTIMHEEPDRVPIGEWGIDHDHVSKILGRQTYWRNRKESTLALWQGKRDEVVENLKNDCAEFTDKLDYDIITVELVAPKGFKVLDVPKQIEEGVWQDAKGNIFKYAASNDSIMSMTSRPEKTKFADSEIEKLTNELCNIDNSEFELVDFVCQKFRDKKAIVIRSVNLYESILDLFGGDQAHQLMMTIIDPEQIKNVGRALFARCRRMIKMCKERGVTIFMCGQDFGGKNGCLIPPKQIRQLFMPFLKMFCDEVSSNGMIPFYHCCGNVWDIMQDFVDVGFKGYQSIQATAGMDIARLKKEYGSKITLWAGIQCETLVEGTKEDVFKEVKNSLKVAMPGGGFIFGSTNSVQYGAKTENYLYVLDLVRKFGKY